MKPSRELLLSVLRVSVCLFSGLIFLQLPEVPLYLRELAKRQATFLLLLILWELALAALAKWRRKQISGQSMQRRDQLWLLPFLVASAVAMATLTSLNQAVSNEFFYACIALLGARALAVGARLQSRPLLAGGMNVLYLFLLALLSAVLSAGSWRWQLGVVAVALASTQAVAELRNYIGNNHPSSLRTLRGHLAALFLGPLSFACLCYYGFLAREYLWILICFLPCYVASEKSRALERSPEAGTEGLLKWSQRAELVFLCAVIGLGVLV